MYASVVRWAAARPLALAVLLLVPALDRAAIAHPLLDEGRRRFESADFQGALEVLSRAEDASDLTAADLIRLLVDRALVQAALGDIPALRRELGRLAIVAPAYDLGVEAPPEVREEFERARTATAGRHILQVDVTPRAGSVALEVRTSGHAASVVRAVRLRGRARGGAWRQAMGSTLVVVAPRGEEVAYHAVAIGPGGAVVAELSSSTRSLGRRGSPARARRGASGWIWLGVGAAVAAVAAVTVALLVSTSGSDDRTQPSFPAVVDR